MREILEMYGYNEFESKVYLEDGNHSINVQGAGSYLESLIQGTDSGGLYENGFIGASMGA
jgi:hypothetical protein